MIDKIVTAQFVRSDGAELTVDGSDWLLTSIEGAAAPGYQVYTSDYAQGDGSVITGQRVAARDLELSACVMDTGLNPVLRRQATSYFQPRRSYKVYLTYLGTTRWISGQLTAFKAPNSYVYEPQTFAAYFICVNPYWQSVDNFGQDIAAITACWGFPYMDSPTFCVRTCVANFARNVVFEYDGDVAAYFQATITCDGPVTNPKLLLGDAYVRVITELLPGDVLSIDLAAARVLLNGENILVRVDRTSNFAGMQMQPGSNTVSFAADVGENQLHVVIYYNKQYLGV